MKITISTQIEKDIQTVWHSWNDPKAIKKWNAASDDWHTTFATVDLKVGGKFTSRMEAKDGSMSFDFEGTYTNIKTQQLIEYKLDDDRIVSIEFSFENNTTTIKETFEAEDEHSGEQQKNGWQSILNNFKKYVEAN